MKKIIFLFLTLLLTSCKDDNWGYKIHDFALRESYGIVNDLSKKDLEIKWYNYFFNLSSYALSEVNRSNYKMVGLEEINMENVEKDTVKLMTVAYKLDQQIQSLYDVNEAIYNADQAYQQLLSACTNQNLYDIYTENRSYLFNSLQMSMPQFNFTYGATITLNFNDGSGKSKGDTGIDSMPLVGNIVSFFSEKTAKKNKQKFQEAQDYINSIKLDSKELQATSYAACISGQKKFLETFDILKSNISLEKDIFSKLYVSLSKLRNNLSPLIIKNIVDNFNSTDRYIYTVQSDTKFTTRMMEMYQVAQQLNSPPPNNAAQIESIEDKIDVASNLIAELEVTKNSVLGIKNNQLVSSLETLLRNKKNGLMNLVNGRLK